MKQYIYIYNINIPGVSSSMYFRMPEADDRDVFMLLYSLYNDVQNNILCMVVSIASRSSQ
jgi:hypothetical protein